MGRCCCLRRCLDRAIRRTRKTDIVVSRADLNAHGDCGGECDGPDPESLGVEVLDVLIVDGGVVTIAARAAPPEKGGTPAVAMPCASTQRIVFG